MIDTQVKISVHAGQRISERTNLTVDDMADGMLSSKPVVTWSGGNITAVVSDSECVAGYVVFKAQQSANGRFI